MLSDHSEYIHAWGAPRCCSLSEGVQRFSHSFLWGKVVIFLMKMGKVLMRVEVRNRVITVY